MLELFLQVLNELNMTTTNLLYFISGIGITVIANLIFSREDIVKIFHQKATALYDMYAFYDVDRQLLMPLYNKVIIRSISIMALNGSLSFKTYDFIDREVALIHDLNKEQAGMLINATKNFLDEVIELRRIHSSKDFFSNITNIVLKRKK